MATFQDLEIDKFYLIKIKQDEEIKMVQVAMETEHCVLVFELSSDDDISYWKKKDDVVAELIEEVSEEKVEEYEELTLEDYDEDFDDYSFDTLDAEEEVEEDDKKDKKKKKK